MEGPIPGQPVPGQPDSRRPDSGRPDLDVASLQTQLNRLSRGIRRAIERRLAAISGQTCDSREANLAMVRQIQDLLDRHSLRVQCPQCGHPAILRVSPRRGMPRGAFVLDHTIDGRRTFHGGTATMPPLRLVAKPARRG